MTVYENDNEGPRIIGYNKGIAFYSPDRTLRQSIYLQSDNTLNIGGSGSSVSSYLTELTASQSFVRLDGNNGALWIPDGGQQSITGSFNLNGAYSYRIGSLPVLQTWATNNVAAGHGFDASGITGDYNTIMGGASLTGGAAGSSLTSGNTNSIYGSGAGAALTEGYSNSIFGYGAAALITTGDYNSIFGVGAGDKIVAANNNSMFGFGAGGNNTASGNDFFGVSSGLSNTSGTGNAEYGFGAGYYNQEGNYNTLFGENAGRGTSYHNKYRNAIFGRLAGLVMQDADDNSIFGYWAAPNLTTGDDNSIFGSGTGAGITTGSANTILGANVTGLAADLANNIILADGDGNIKLQFATATWTATGTINATTAIQLNGTSINTGATLTNVAYLDQANVFTLINPLTTIAESWIGPSSATGIYFKGGNVGIGIAPSYPFHVYRAGCRPGGGGEL